MAAPPMIPGVIEAMETCRAIRRFRPDPVPDDLVVRLVYAATRAPSASNVQSWAFIAVRSPQLKQEVARLIAPASIANLHRLLPLAASPRERLMYRDSLELAENLGEVPLLLFVCATGVERSQPVNPRVWMAVYPAAQNLLVAARSLGLGTTLATYHLNDQEGLERLLRLPGDTIVAATIALGWPAVAFGPVRRRPVGEVLHWDRW
jgi:nitroreductase